jgi:uncharacterized membrane protein
MRPNRKGSEDRHGTRRVASVRDSDEPVDPPHRRWHRDIWCFIIVVGIIWSSRYIFLRSDASRYDHYKISIGRSLLLGLEVLVAADIVKTIAIELTFVSLGLLAGLVLVRTCWTLVLEIEGRWPWQREPAAMRHDDTQDSRRS